MFSTESKVRRARERKRRERARRIKVDLKVGIGGPEEEEECRGAEFQEGLQWRRCTPAGSMSWLPRHVFIRLQRKNQNNREREKAEIRVC